MMLIDFATFCCKKDAHRLHAPGQLRRQVESNGYPFHQIITVHQLCNPADYAPFDLETKTIVIDDLDAVLHRFNIDIDKPQYVSQTDKAHAYKFHVVNHLAAVEASQSDYIVFADADSWIVHQPDSWVQRGIDYLAANPYCLIVSPNDGEPERATRVISQQMFLARTNQFRQLDFNQPGWDGDVTKLSEMPEYASMMEGRLHFYCEWAGMYRYVLPQEYRYWHHNRINPTTNHFELDRNKY